MCSEVQAAYLETLNLIASLTRGNDTAAEVVGKSYEIHIHGERIPPSALLRAQLAIRTAHKAALTGDRALVDGTLAELLEGDVDTAAILLEAIPETFSVQKSPDTAAWLCRLVRTLRRFDLV